MTTATFHPARLHGTAPVPPAKSEAHRALLLAALGRGVCRLHGFPPPLCDDTEAMINGISALGACVEREGDVLVVTPAPPAPALAEPQTFHVNACAAALRMLIPAFWARGQSVRITMEEGLFARPLDAFAPLAERIGGSLTLTPPTNGCPAAVELRGKMDAGLYEIDGTLSSQFASGLLVSLSHGMDTTGRLAPSQLTVTRPIVSRPYLDMTLAQMKRFGIGYQEREEGVFTLLPAESRNPDDIDVAGDWSQGAVLLCANAMGNGVAVQGLHEPMAGKPLMQGDARIVEILKSMGLSACQRSGVLWMTGIPESGLAPLALDCTDIPDIVPILALTCTQAKGTSVLTGVKRLRVKECDRLDATVGLLTRLGAKIQASGDSDTLTVEGQGTATLCGGFTADARGDHRMVMLLATAALIADAPITVTGVNSLDKSWPGFLAAYQALGGMIS